MEQTVETQNRPSSIVSTLAKNLFLDYLLSDTKIPSKNIIDSETIEDYVSEIDPILQEFEETEKKDAYNIAIEFDQPFEEDFEYERADLDDYMVDYLLSELSGEDDVSEENTFSSMLDIEPDYNDGEESLFTFWQKYIAQLPRYLWWMNYDNF